MDRRRSWSMYSPHFKRPQPPDDGGWRATFLLIFAIIGLMGVGSVLMVARTVHALDVEMAAERLARESPVQRTVMLVRRTD